MKMFALGDEAVANVFGHEAGHVVGLVDFYGPPEPQHAMSGQVEPGAYLNNGYWATFGPAIPGYFRVKP
ncbi:MAG: hypothetical protein GWP08_18180 [Nitrospiraceae bacterium]|nr:hypothetical protein [Nitrospiraceae bacterium]